MVINGINTKDISVVVQGAVDPVVTKKCLASVRKYLPGAEIILSTWKDMDIRNLDADIILQNKDPGVLSPTYAFGEIYPANQNRQLISTQEGIKKCSRGFIIKLRSDCWLKNVNFMYFFNRYPLRNDMDSLFKNRVICSSIYSRRFSDFNGFPTPFHVSDFFFFGKSEDVRDYFLGTSIDNRDDFVHYEFPDRKPYPSVTYRFFPEQYFCIEWLKRHSIETSLHDLTAWSENVLMFSDKILFNNFIFLDPKDIGLASFKHDVALKEAIGNYGIISHKFFEEAYKMNFTPPPRTYV